MGLFDKLSNLIFEEDDSNGNNAKNKSKISSPKKGSWKDIFFEDASEVKTPSEKKKGSFLDLFFEDAPDDGVKSTFVDGEEKTSVLTDISSQIERRESELINLGEFFKTVNPKDYPDSGPEYEAYLSLVKQLNQIKVLSDSSKNATIESMRNYQLEGAFRKFELDYQAHINAIQSLCYLSEIASLNSEMNELFHSNFTNRTEHRINQTEDYITLISEKSNKFDKKYSARLYKELIEAEYRLTLLKLMNELKNNNAPRRNPFSSFPPEKKKTFETYLSKDLRDSNVKYNAIADNMDGYIKYNLVREELFTKIDKDAEVISERINQYTIDDFLLTELFENGEGYETLKKFLRFKLRLNFIDSKTAEVNERSLNDTYHGVMAARSESSGKKTSSSGKHSKKGKKFPDFDEDL